MVPARDDHNLSRQAEFAIRDEDGRARSAGSLPARSWLACTRTCAAAAAASAPQVNEMFRDTGRPLATVARSMFR